MCNTGRPIQTFNRACAVMHCVLH